MPAGYALIAAAHGARTRSRAIALLELANSWELLWAVPSAR